MWLLKPLKFNKLLQDTKNQYVLFRYRIKHKERGAVHIKYLEITKIILNSNHFKESSWCQILMNYLMLELNLYYF